MLPILDAAIPQRNPEKDGKPALSDSIVYQRALSQVYRYKMCHFLTPLLWAIQDAVMGLGSNRHRWVLPSGID